MSCVEYRADGHQVDDAGNLISCAYVDLRDPEEHHPILALQKASSKRHAIPGCETIRISKPSCFLGRGEGHISGDEARYGTNGWVYCAFIEPETAAELAAWRASMPAGYDALSPIRRPRAFAQALGCITAEQAGPRGRAVLLRNTIDGHALCAAHRSQRVYHGPVVYANDPHGRLERASSDLELKLLLVFLKDAAYRDQREYRFAVWAEREPEEDGLDLEVSLGLLDAMCSPRQRPEGRRLLPPAVEEPSSVEDLDAGGFPPAAGGVQTPPGLWAAADSRVLSLAERHRTVPARAGLPRRRRNS